ncbi:hypothetical protein E3T21_00120 [Cryobacterium sp. TMB3-15]|nr:hypothetical protein E3T21_00120 [Cryobacterium sp. TMB3-15]TFC77878.1 hypothetical protein E3T22_04645 [Cryobacterium sp. TMB3-10]
MTRLQLIYHRHERCSISSCWIQTEFLQFPLTLPEFTGCASMRALPCTQLTVLLGPLRALAIATGININGDQFVDVDQGNN